MPAISYKNLQGVDAGEFHLSDDIFGIEPNIHVMYEAVKMYRANKRQGTVFVKGRSDVSGTTKKPFRQKGTGRARQGNEKVPHFRGGGIPFGPKPRDFSYSMPKKAKRLALFSALSGKCRDDEVIVIDNLSLEKPKTRDAFSVLKNLNLDKQKVLLVCCGDEPNVFLAFRNLHNVHIIRAQNLNTYDLLNAKYVLITRSALDQIEEVFGQ